MTFAFIIFNCKPWNEIKSYGLLNGTTKITHEAKKPFLDCISFNLFIVGAFFCLRSLCLNIDGSNMHFLATNFDDVQSFLNFKAYDSDLGHSWTKLHWSNSSKSKSQNLYSER